MIVNNMDTYLAPSASSSSSCRFAPVEIPTYIWSPASMHSFIHCSGKKKKRKKGGKAYSKGPQQQHQQQQPPYENARKRLLTAYEDDARTIEHGARSHGDSRRNCSSSEPRITNNSGKLQERRRSNQVSPSS
jgi:hypothetical protein